MYIVVICGLYGASIKEFTYKLTQKFSDANININVIESVDEKLKHITTNNEQFLLLLEQDIICSIKSAQITIIAESQALSFQLIKPNFKIFIHCDKDLALANILRGFDDADNASKFLNEYEEYVKPINDAIEKKQSLCNLVVHNIDDGVDNAYILINALRS